MENSADKLPLISLTPTAESPLDQLENFSVLLERSSQVTETNFLTENGHGLMNAKEVPEPESVTVMSVKINEQDWVTTSMLYSYSADKLIHRLGLSDNDLLGSLPWKPVTACPVCFSRAVTERKTDHEEGKYYCSVCRKRVKADIFPYYTESYSAYAHTAVEKHRRYLVRQLNDKLQGLKRLETLKISHWRRRCYFLSIDEINSKTYDTLSKLYDSFYVDNTFDKPDTKLQIQLCSNGGDVQQAHRIIALINANKHITHVQGTLLKSAAFRVFFSVECSKGLWEMAEGMFHQSRSAQYVLENGQLLHGATTTSNQDTLQFCTRIGMNTDEIERVKDGEDVDFNRSRLQQLLEYVETLNSPYSESVFLAYVEDDIPLP